MSQIPLDTCITCKKTWDQSPRAFQVRKTKTAKKGDPLPRCQACQDRQNNTENRKKRKERESYDPEGIYGTPSLKLHGLAELEGILNALSLEPWTTFNARIEGIKIEGESPKKCALRIAAIIRGYTGYKFVYRGEKPNSKLSVTTVRLDCTQKDTIGQAPKKPCLNPSKVRVRRRMKRFPCNGSLKIRIHDHLDQIDVALEHHTTHKPYRDITIPQEWQTFIKARIDLSPAKLWLKILLENQRKGTKMPKVRFTQRSVYHYWTQLKSHEWRHAEDPIESAKEYLKANEDEHDVQILELEQEPGTRVIAFTVIDFMKFGDWTQSFLTDSTFGVNKQNLELFAGVADIQGEGLPLSFLFIDMDKTAAEGAKQRVLTSWYSELKHRGVDPDFTLSDKDDSEINAMRAVWPLAKHQLCLWHALRALKQRLAKIKEGLAFYDAAMANAEFDFINISFLPYAMLTANKEMPHSPPRKPIFAIKLTVDGRPPIIAHAPIVAERVQTCTETPTTNKNGATIPDDDNNDARSDEGDFFADKAERQKAAADGLLGDEEFDDDGNGDGAQEEFRQMLKEAELAMANLVKKFKRNDQSGNNSKDSELDSESEGSSGDSDNSDYQPGKGQGKVQVQRAPNAAITKPPKKPTNPKNTQTQAKEKESVPEYQFCPPAHRLSILRIFSRHFNQHPLLPERHGQSRNSKEIYCDAVKEMYLHCEQNHLCDVWAYLWVNWYCPKMWPLWARSYYGEAIPQKQTTMTVESLWRNYKHLSMPHHARVSANYSIHLLITKTIVAYRQRLLKHTDKDPREGRAKGLTAEQAEFKKSWQTFALSKIKGSDDTDSNRWTCSCGSQKYNTHLLCKHLVQSIPTPPDDWWPEVIRYLVPPFYVVPGVPDPMEPEKITGYGWRSRRAENSAPPSTLTGLIMGSPQRQSAANGLEQVRITNLNGPVEEKDKITRLSDIKTLLGRFIWEIDSQMEVQGENLTTVYFRLWNEVSTLLGNSKMPWMSTEMHVHREERSQKLSVDVGI